MVYFFALLIIAFVRKSLPASRMRGVLLECYTLAQFYLQINVCVLG